MAASSPAGAQVEAVAARIDDVAAPLAGVVITHPHPDHYAGLASIVGDDDVPIVATSAVDAVIRRDDTLKDGVVGPMLGPEWPSDRRFPNRVVSDGDRIELGGVTLVVDELGPGESHADTMWWLDDTTVFAGDVVYHDMHAYLADGHSVEWLTVLDHLEQRLPHDVTLLVGHGPPAARADLARQRRYIEAFVDAVTRFATGSTTATTNPSSTPCSPCSPPTTSSSSWTSASTPCATTSTPPRSEASGRQRRTTV